jgi:hypothetical protein
MSPNPWDSKAEEKVRNWKVVALVFLWIIWTLCRYYYLNFFFVILAWIGLVAIIGIITIVQIVTLFKRWKHKGKFRVVRLSIYVSLFLLTFLQPYTDRVIEKCDWLLQRERRELIVEQIKSEKIAEDSTRYQLPYKFPIVSHYDNEVDIRRVNGKITISFWVFRNFFELRSPKFVYSNDPDEIEEFDRLVNNMPKYNWQLDENWFRIGSE